MCPNLALSSHCHGFYGGLRYGGLRHDDNGGDFLRLAKIVSCTPTHESTTEALQPHHLSNRRYKSAIFCTQIVLKFRTRRICGEDSGVIILPHPVHFAQFWLIRRERKFALVSPNEKRKFRCIFRSRGEDWKSAEHLTLQTHLNLFANSSLGDFGDSPN